MAKLESKKHYAFNVAASKYETREEAEVAAKKYLATYSKNYGDGHDVTVYEAIASVKAPVPSYEVADIK